MKKKYICGTCCIIIDELLWILDPEDGGILLKNVNLWMWMIILTVSIVVLTLYLIKLNKSQDKKQYVLTYDGIFEVGVIVLITSFVNIILRLIRL